jgi:predicted ArsR family transcriptional regulator
MPIQPVPSESSRTQILHLLRKSEGGLSTEELRRSLNVTTMAVSRQLALLEGQGLIYSELIRKPRGRPVHVFRLTDSADDFFPRTYSQLVMDLLHELSAREGIARVRKLFDQRFKRIVDSCKQRIGKKDLAGRVAETTKILEENGYLSESQKVNSRKYLLKLYNCPISKVAKEYPHVCSCEKSSLGLMTESKVTRDHHILSGQNYCSYTIEKKS